MLLMLITVIQQNTESQETTSMSAQTGFPNSHTTGSQSCLGHTYTFWDPEFAIVTELRSRCVVNPTRVSDVARTAKNQ